MYLKSLHLVIIQFKSYGTNLALLKAQIIEKHLNKFKKKVHFNSPKFPELVLVCWIRGRLTMVTRVEICKDRLGSQKITVNIKKNSNIKSILLNIVEYMYLE